MNRIGGLILLACWLSVTQAEVRVETIASGFPGSGGVSVGPDGNIYVSDYGPRLSQPNGNTIWRITPSGERSVFVSGLSGASGSEFDSQGNLYQSHLNGGTIRRISPEGQVSLYSSGHSGPIGIAINADDELFVANCGTNSIRQAIPNGGSTLYAQSPLMACPNGLSVDEQNNLYAVNFNNSNMLKITPDGQTTRFATIPGGGNGHVRYHDGALYTVSWQGDRVYRVSLDGEVTALAGTGFPGREDGPGDEARFFRPNGIDLSADGRFIYVNDTDVIDSSDLLHSNSLRAIRLDALSQINAGLVGAWYEPSTAGSGLLFDLVAGRDELFGAWYSYVRPETALAGGENEQRWYTVQGPYSGNRAEVLIYQTTGGRLLAPDPTSTVAVGSGSIRFDSCTEALFEFQFDGDPGPTALPLVRLSPDVLCAQGGLAADLNADPVTIRYIGNLGVILRYGEQQVIIDGVLGSASGWVEPTADERTAIIEGSGLYVDVEVAAVTHRHGDHISSSVANQFLSRQPNAMFIGSPAAGVGGSISRPGQTLPINLTRFANQQIEVNGVSLTVYHTRHFNQFGNDFSNEINLSYLVELGGRKILHLGDFDYAADNIQALGLAPGELDAVIMPTFNTLISAANFALISDLLAPGTIIAAHLQSAQLSSERNRVLNLLPDAVIFDSPGEEFELNRRQVARHATP